MPRTGGGGGRSGGGGGRSSGGGGRSSGGGGGSKSSGGGGVVHVRGYTRSDGTHVAGYTRSLPSSASRSSSATASRSATTSGMSVGSYGGYSSAASPMSTSGTGVVHVRGYTRSDGTKVAGYTRASPKSTSKPASAASIGVRDTVQVSGYTRADGTYVPGYTRSRPGSSSQSQSSSSAKAGANSTDGNVVHVQSYTRANGTVVPAHTRSRPGMKSGDSKSTGEKRTYVDNAFNRKHNRVGLEVGTYVISKNPTTISSGQKEGATANSDKKTTTNEKKQHFYVDNPHNRRLGRAGKPIPPRKGLRKKMMEENTVEELRLHYRNLQFAYPDYDLDYQCALINAVDDMEREEVEEKWRETNVDPETNVTQLSQVQLHDKIIPFYELQLEQKPIGRGGFGEVYAAMWHGTPVAFKKFHHQHMSKHNKESFKMEVMVLASLNRPNIVRMFGAVIEAGNIGIVMEYMRCSLFHAIFVDDETEFSDSEKKAIVSQTVDAVQYLHTHDPKIVHCDIKSENILLDKNNNAKLTDFGLSTMKNDTESSQSNQGAVPPGRGTPRYSAPEILRGEILTMDQLIPADIYSLSIVVFEVIIEEEPFPGLSIRQLEENVGRRNLRPTLPATVTWPVEDLLKRCWDDNAFNRPTAGEFQHIWSGIMELYKDY